MAYMYRLWLMIVRRNRHSILLFLLVFFFSLFGIVSIFFGSVVESYQHAVVADIGYSLILYKLDDTDIPQDIMRQISEIRGVIGMNQESNMLVTPVNFENIIEVSEDNVFDIPSSDLVRLYADTDTAVNLVYANHMRLTAGELPSTTNAGAMIEATLAEKNNLGIGDTITVKHPETGKELSLSIIGIYELLSLPQESWSAGGGEIAYGQSPYSYIFCDMHSYEILLEREIPLSSVIIYTQNARYLDRVSEAISRMNLSTEEYQLINRTESELEMGTSASRAIGSAATVLSIVSITVSASVLLLVVLLWMRSCYKDISILISLGEKRAEIIRDYLLVTTIISVGALLLSLPLCVTVIGLFGDQLVESVFVATGNLSGLEIDNYMLTALEQPLGMIDYLKSQGVLLIVVWVATLLASISVLKNKPSKLFNMS